jgi:hypothetical protein
VLQQVGDDQLSTLQLEMIELLSQEIEVVISALINEITNSLSEKICTVDLQVQPIRTQKSIFDQIYQEKLHFLVDR